MFDKYLYALGRGVRSVRQALDDGKSDDRTKPAGDPAQSARDVTPPRAAAAAPTRPQDDVSEAMLTRAPLVLGARPLVMGVVNVTPDSFSDGGLFLEAEKAIAHGAQLLREGADCLDIGGESTRPGAGAVTVEDEIARVSPVLRGLAATTSKPLSIDTMKAKVAAAAIDCGASVVNDVWGFRFDADMARVVAANGVHCVLMHNRAQDDPQVDMFAEVVDFLQRSVAIALAAGVAQQKIIVDPGIGFGKTAGQGFELVRRLPELKEKLDLPVLLGVSRKRLIGAATGRPANERMVGTVAAGLWGAQHGADILRVHDVAAQVDALSVLAAIKSGGRSLSRERTKA